MELKCIDIKSNAFKVPLLIWLIAVLVLVAVHPVRAETGTITISTSPAITYLAQATGNTNVNWSVMVVDYQDYSSFSEIDMSLSLWSATLPSNYTFFTWKDIDINGAPVSGGSSGSGMFTYRTGTCNVQCLNMTWVFSPQVNPKSGRLNISYDDYSVISQITPTDHTIESSTSYPFGLGTVWTGSKTRIMAGQNSFGNNLGNFRVYTGISISNFYDISYPIPGFFRINVSKTGQTVQTKDYINTSTNGIYTADTSFNTNTLSFFGNQLTGIYINMTTATGLYSNVLINSSGIAVIPTPTPAPGGQFNPPLSIPSSGGSIQFNKTKYVVGDTVRVEWAIADADWNGIGQTFAIGLFQDNLPMTVVSAPAVSSQSGSYSFKFNTPASIKAVLYGGFLLANNVLGTAYTSVVPEQTSTIIVPANVPIGKNFSVIYMYGFTPFVQTYANGVYAVDSSGVVKTFVPTLFISPSIVALTSYTTNITVPTAGEFTIQLKDFTRGVVASAHVVASTSFVLPQNNISTSYITLDSSSYNLGDSIQYSYAVDNVNWSNYNNYLRISNYTTGKIFNYPLSTTQTGAWYIPSYDGIDPYDGSHYQIPVGLTRVAIRASNTSSDFEVVFANFTFSRLNLAGYKLELTKHGNDKICQGETIYAKVTIPSQQTTVNILVSNTGKFVYQQNFSNTTTIPIKIITSDVYLIDVISQPGDVVQVLDAFTISNCVGAATPTPSTGNQASAKTTQVSNLLSSDVFWSLIIISGLTIFIAKETRKKT